MAQQKLFAIKDSRAEFFVQAPFPQHTHGEAERTFSQLVNDPKTIMGQSPQDYHLYYFGTWESTSGKMELLDAPEHLIAGDQLKKQATPQISAVN